MCTVKPRCKLASWELYMAASRDAAAVLTVLPFSCSIISPHTPWPDRLLHPPRVDNDMESEEDYLSKTLGGTALGGGGGNEQYERQRSGISEVAP